MRMNDSRLVKMVMLEALEVGSKVKWVKDLQQSLEKLGWRGLNVVALDGLTINEVKQLLKDAGMAYKFNRDMHACFARNYPEARFCKNAVDGAP